jgi:RimJ/RimL family protein N-acetyltransferase
VTEPDADTLLTPRLRLERLTARDLPALHAIQSDPAVWRHHPPGVAVERAETEELLASIDTAWRNAGLGLRGVRTRDDAALLGTCGVMPFYLGGRRVWNLGYRLAAPAHGHGYATEAALAVVAEVHERFPGEGIIGRVLEHNPASVAVLEKAGLAVARRGPASPDHLVPAGGGSAAGGIAVRRLYADRELPDDLADTLISLG